MAAHDISHAKLWSASWDGLCRLARSLGLKVPPDEPEEYRGALVEAVMRRIGETMLEQAAKRRRKKGAVEGYVVRDSRASRS